MFLLGTGIQNWIKWKCRIPHRHQCAVGIQMPYQDIWNNTIMKNWRVDGESQWKRLRAGTVTENWKEEEAEQKSREEMKGCGCDSDSNAAFEITDAPSSRLLQVQNGVCMWLRMYMMTLFAVSPVLAGRSCLCVALSHHLFLARLLISVLIISCSPLSV